MTQMPRGLVIFMPVILLLAGVGMVALVWGSHSSGRMPVYTVDQFLNGGPGFDMHLGESALVQGRMTCGEYTDICWITGKALESPGGIGLMVYRGTESRLVAMFRGAPFIGQLMPYTAAHPFTGHDAVYRVVFVGCPNAPACPNWMTEWRLDDGGSS